MMPTSASEWLMGGGELAELMRTTDFNRTPLGDRSRWAQSLRTAVNMIIETPVPSALLCGPDLIVLYNDACRVIADEQHPRALGRSIREVWPDAWQSIAARIAAIQGGGTIVLEHQRLPADGHDQGPSFTLCASPVRGEDGSVIASLVTLLVTPERARRERDVQAERERCVASLRRREQDRVRAFLNGSPAIAWAKDTGGHHVYLNAAYEREFGLRPEGLRSLPEARVGLGGDDLEVLRNGGPVQRIEERRDVEGRARSWLVSEFRFQDASGSNCVGGIGIDITELRRAEIELARAAELLELGDAFLELDRDFRIVRVNTNLELVAQAPRAAMLGRVFWEAWPETAHPDSTYWRECHRCMAERVAVEFEGYYPPLDLWTDMTAYPTSAGGIAIFIRNSTERKRMEQALRRRETTLAQAGKMAHLGAWEMEIVTPGDLDSAIITWSDEAYRIFGYEPDSVRITNPFFYERVHADDRERVARTLDEAVEHRAPYGVEYRIVRPDGTQRYVHEHAELLLDAQGNLQRAVGAVLDITERKLAEEALREADQRKDEFLAMLSHELRNPLAPIRNSLYVLDRSPPDSEAARRARATIDRQVSHLTRLVGDLLDVSRIKRGRFELRREPLDLVAVVERTVDDHRSLFAERGIELDFERPSAAIRVNGDAARLAQAVANVLQNAAKFTPRSGRVRVDTRREGATVALTVRDTGVGIPPEVLGRIFEPFTQADHSLDRSSGGLGLGLSLVKGLVNLHGGDVYASSEGPGRGAEFRIVLPADAEVEFASAPHVQHEHARRRRVLVIEDNADAAESLKEALELDAHEVLLAFSGVDGLAKARAYLPDVVLCDIGLPGMNGYEVARAFRSDETLRTISLVALTGYAGPEDRRNSASAGFDHHVAKPPDMDAIERILAGVPERPKPGLGVSIGA